MNKLRVLAVGAHPDDLEITCGGTLARYARAGHTVVMAHLLNGDKGHYRMAPAELVKIRREEARRAAAVIGAESVTLDMPDGMLYSCAETRQRVIDLVREVKPDVVITH